MQNIEFDSTVKMVLKDTESCDGVSNMLVVKENGKIHVLEVDKSSSGELWKKNN